MKTPFSPNLRRGFTILELLVAMVITTLIVIVLVGITSVALDAWNRSRSELRASRQAKSMVDTMARDFEAMVARRSNSFEWLYAKTATAVGPSAQPSTNAADLIFFTAATDRYSGQINTTTDKGGDVSCVSYKLAYQDLVVGTDTSFSTFAMYRLLVNPDETFTTLLGKPILSTAFLPYSSKVKSPENFVCENVYQFTVRFNVEVQKTGSTTKVLVPVTLGSATGQFQQFQLLGTGLVVASSSSSAVTLDELNELKAGRIVSAEISLTVLSDFGVNRLKIPGFTFKNDTEKGKFFAANSYQYSKVVELPRL